MKVKKRLKTTIVGLLFILPFLILYTVFTIWPVIKGVYVSFYKWSLMGKIKSVGLSNFKRMAIDGKFIEALQHTILFVVISVPFLVLTALILALLANRPIRLKKFFRVSFYLPCILSVSVASYIAKYVYAPYRGLINGILHAFHIIPPDYEVLWLQNLNLVWGTIVSMTVWWTVGFSMMLYISALQNISDEIYEAAKLDGAGKMQEVFFIQIPMLKPTTYLIVLLQIIASFKVFGQIYLITGGGPASVTKPLIQYIYETAFAKNNLGYASAMSYVLFAILVIVSLVEQRIERRSNKE